MWFQNGMENNYYLIQINHIQFINKGLLMHSKENCIDHKGKCETVIYDLPKIEVGGEGSFDLLNSMIYDP